MRIDIISIFPDYLTPLELSLVGRARATGALDVHIHDLRHWTHDVHRTVDDTPYGGGPGMVMRPEPWGEALDHVTAGVTAGPPRAPADQESADLPWLVIPSPAGVPFTQRLAETLAVRPWLVFACGRYEGIDQRVHDHVAARMPVTEVSIGDYVVFGGEVATLVVVEAVTRLLPGVLGNAASLEEESHTGGVLEAPMYTKPAEWRGHEVPAVLRSGDHARIDRWRRDQSLLRTLDRRPDLLSALPPDTLNRQDRATLAGAGFQEDVTDVAE